MLEALIDFKQGCRRSVCENIIILHHFYLCITLTDYTLIRIKHLCTCSPVIAKSLSFVTGVLLWLSACCLAELLWDALSCCKDLWVFDENQTNHLCSFVCGIQRNTVVLLHPGDCWTCDALFYPFWLWEMLDHCHYQRFKIMDAVHEIITLKCWFSLNLVN